MSAMWTKYCYVLRRILLSRLLMTSRKGNAFKFWRRMSLFGDILQGHIKTPILGSDIHSNLTGIRFLLKPGFRSALKTAVKYDRRTA